MVTGQITEQEFVAAYTLHRRKTVFLIKLIAGIAFMIGLAILFFSPSRAGVLFVFCALGSLLGEFVQDRFFLRPRLRRLYAQTRGRVDLTYSWDNQNLFLSSAHGQAARPWSDFLKARESEQLILLYLNDVVFEMIAKRWFGNAGDLAAFRAHLKFVS
jgi:hypothetical protein